MLQVGLIDRILDDENIKAAIHAVKIEMARNRVMACPRRGKPCRNMVATAKPIPFKDAIYGPVRTVQQKARGIPELGVPERVWEGRGRKPSLYPIAGGPSHGQGLALGGGASVPSGGLHEAEDVLRRGHVGDVVPRRARVRLHAAQLAGLTGYLPYLRAAAMKASRFSMGTSPFRSQPVQRTYPWALS